MIRRSIPRVSLRAGKAFTANQSRTARLSGRSVSTKSFEPATYTPEPRLNSRAIGKLLSQSIIGDMSEEEAKICIELAACYRLFEHAGWNENINNHLSAKVVEPDGLESFLINSYGLKYGEITASSLVKVAYDGPIKRSGITGDLFGVNDAGFVIHSAIHKGRPELRSVMHCRYPSATGVASTKQEFLELAQTSHQIGDVAYHDYNGIVVDRAEQKGLVSDIGDKNILFLRVHGVITAATSVAATWFLMYQLSKATDIQSHASACALGDRANLTLPPAHTVEKTFKTVRDLKLTGLQYGFKELSAYMRWLYKADISYRL